MPTASYNKIIRRAKKPPADPLRAERKNTVYKQARAGYGEFLKKKNASFLPLDRELLDRECFGSQFIPESNLG